jgi:poly(3-hydroxybutyrate) depolymerase
MKTLGHIVDSHGFARMLTYAVLFASVAAAQSGSFTVGGQTRTFITHAPTGLPASPALVINMHGLGMNASLEETTTQMDKTADREKFIVVYPDGTGSTAWDISGNGDVPFLLALVDTIGAKYNVDRNRVYACGFSMGGYMTHRLGCAAANVFAAIAAVSGLNASMSCAPPRPISVMQIHGTSDPIVAFSGVAGTISGWVSRNGCPSAVQITDPYPAGNASSIVRKEYYGPCKNNNEVILLAVNGGGHSWPNSASSIVASDEIWTFFTRHTLTTSRTIDAQRDVSNNRRITAKYSKDNIYLTGVHDVQSARIINLKGQTLVEWSSSSTTPLNPSLTVPANLVIKGICLMSVRTAEGSFYTCIAVSNF